MFGHKWFLKIGELSDASCVALMNDANELIHCDFSLYQLVDGKGQAQSNVRLGDIIATYDGLPSQEMIEWALDSRKYFNGALVLYDSLEIPLNKIFFQDSACIGLNLSYSSSGKSSILTQIRVKPRKIIIDEDSVDQHWTGFADLAVLSSYGNSGSLKKNIFKLAQPLGKLSLDLILEEAVYEIESFDISFEQPYDFKGQPQDLVHGGAIKFSIPSIADRKLNQWMMRGDMLKSGKFVFNRGDQNSPLKIEFDEAYCINLTNRTTGGKGMSTSLVISANEVRMNDKACCNHFKL